MAIRRRALERVGPFDETTRGRGDEEDWERRYIAAGGRIRYLAAAGLDHRRTAADATVRRLARAAYAQGAPPRRYDVRKGAAPAAARRAAHAGRLLLARRPPPLRQRLIARAHAAAAGRCARRWRGRPVSAAVGCR